MIRYRKLGYVALNVTELERSRRFYEDTVGLQLNGVAPDGGAFLRFNEAHHNIMLYEAPRAGFKRFGWQLESEAQFDVLANALARRDITLDEVDPAECEALGKAPVRFKDPFAGFVWEFYATTREERAPFTPTVVQFDRLGHVVLKTDRFEEAVEFYGEVLNFRLSDMVEGVIAFLRAFPNKYHHMFAIAKGDRPGLHHLNFMVSSIDEWGRCTARLPRENVPVVWGPSWHQRRYIFSLLPRSRRADVGIRLWDGGVSRSRSA